jgi:hypothetical protein
MSMIMSFWSDWVDIPIHILRIHSIPNHFMVTIDDYNFLLPLHHFFLVCPFKVPLYFVRSNISLRKRKTHRNKYGHLLWRHRLILIAFESNDN